MALYHIEDTKYFSGEEDVVIPKHVLEEHAAMGGTPREENQSGSELEKKATVTDKETDASI
jgi:hypothetical protein